MSEGESGGASGCVLLGAGGGASWELVSLWEGMRDPWASLMEVLNDGNVRV